MAPTNWHELTSGERRRLVAFAALRSLATATVLVALYYVVPLDHIHSVALTVVSGLVILIIATVFELWLITRAPYPSLRAIEALAATLPLFLLLFASAYYTMANAGRGNFNTSLLTRTDSIYFTVTVFATVGFGDITATSQSARLLVTAQMLLDLLIFGLVVRAFMAAIQLARRHSAVIGEPRPSAEQTPNQ